MHAHTYYSHHTHVYITYFVASPAIVDSCVTVRLDALKNELAPHKSAASRSLRPQGAPQATKRSTAYLNN